MIRTLSGFIDWMARDNTCNSRHDDDDDQPRGFTREDEARLQRSVKAGYLRPEDLPAERSRIDYEKKRFPRGVI